MTGRFFMMAFGLAIAASSASAQQQTAESQALSNRLLQEISTGLQCQTSLITAQRELEELKKKHAEESAPTGSNPAPPTKPPK